MQRQKGFGRRRRSLWCRVRANLAGTTQTPFTGLKARERVEFRSPVKASSLRLLFGRRI